MRLKICKGKVRLFFWLPLSAVKGRLALKIATKAAEDMKKVSETQSDKQQTPHEQDTALLQIAPHESPATQNQGAESQSLSVTREFLKQIHKALKEYVKQNGHFSLVDISADKGKTKLKIRI